VMGRAVALVLLVAAAAAANVGTGAALEPNVAAASGLRGCEWRETCRECLLSSSCGWCSGGANERPRCLPGTREEATVARSVCATDASKWHFMSCPAQRPHRWRVAKSFANARNWRLTDGEDKVPSLADLAALRDEANTLPQPNPTPAPTLNATELIAVQKQLEKEFRAECKKKKKKHQNCIKPAAIDLEARKQLALARRAQHDAMAAEDDAQKKRRRALSLLRNAERLKHRAKLQSDNIAPHTAQEAKLVIAATKQQIKELQDMETKLRKRMEIAEESLRRATATNVTNSTPANATKF